MVPTKAQEFSQNFSAFISLSNPRAKVPKRPLCAKRPAFGRVRFPRNVVPSQIPALAPRRLQPNVLIGTNRCFRLASETTSLLFDTFFNQRSIHTFIYALFDVGGRAEVRFRWILTSDFGKRILFIETEGFPAQISGPKPP